MTALAEIAGARWAANRPLTQPRRAQASSAVLSLPISSQDARLSAPREEYHGRKAQEAEPHGEDVLSKSPTLLGAIGVRSCVENEVAPTATAAAPTLGSLRHWRLEGSRAG
eukprot:CAMPEP_0180570326 /NCGR_PEP_ID=MMETSP1037_2-20121125/8144_1 /TAXON_ID=632150 /ORGANISM="Azadinium spinosum, Strain 3D9" /LENGTH=110 /DNA_ID=CAMNT_0022587605 /DNA_START=88 /DNA_END=418 /DNA_ORIENTATION=-